ncbi:MAG TPA: GtrA family protein [Roseateles sp.]|uniref:GtrA family protein n=1 Tax=Roseateles sp. TaxID=1971397 RepID=UPI002ED82A2D
MSQSQSATLVKFIIVGLTNTGVTLSVIFATKYFWGLADAPANALGYVLGLINGYNLNRRWTFRHTGSVVRSLPAFLLIQGVAYVVNLACVLGLIALGVNDYGAHVLGMVPYAIISYLGSRHVAFSAKTAAERPGAR